MQILQYLDYFKPTFLAIYRTGNLNCKSCNNNSASKSLFLLFLEHDLEIANLAIYYILSKSVQIYKK